MDVNTQYLQNKIQHIIDSQAQSLLKGIDSTKALPSDLLPTCTAQLNKLDQKFRIIVKAQENTYIAQPEVKFHYPFIKIKGDILSKPINIDLNLKSVEQLSLVPKLYKQEVREFEFNVIIPKFIKEEALPTSNIQSILTDQSTMMVMLSNI